MNKERKEAIRKRFERAATGLENATGPNAGNRYAPLELRKSILHRDGYTCRYCGASVTDENANIDHVVAWPQGMTVRLNLVTACRPCNQAKGGVYVIPTPLPGERYFRLRHPAPVKPLTTKAHAQVLTFRLPEDTVELERGRCKACGIPVSRVRRAGREVIIGQDGLTHYKYCTHRYATQKKYVKHPLRGSSSSEWRRRV